MKVFRNNICYIDLNDLSRLNLSNSHKENKIEIEDMEFAEIQDPKVIDSINKRDDIIDYDDVSCLSLSQLTEKINRIYDCLDIVAVKWIRTPNNLKSKLYNDGTFMREYKKYENLCNGLLQYYNKKDAIDNAISRLTKEQEKKLIKK